MRRTNAIASSPAPSARSAARRPAALALVWMTTSAARAAIFGDGFESGNLSAWSSTAP